MDEKQFADLIKALGEIRDEIRALRGDQVRNIKRAITDRISANGRRA